MLKSAIVLVGGKGSRFSNIKSPPKHLAKIGGETIISRIINLLAKNNIEEIIFPLGYKKKFYYKFFKSKKNQKKYNFTTQKKKIPNKINIKLFDAGLKSTKLIRIFKSIKYLENEDFLVTYGDGLADINILKLNQIYIKNNKQKALISTLKKRSQYGHIVIDKNKNVKKFVEKPLLFDPINIGYFIFNKKIFKYFFNKKYELEKEFLYNLIKKKLLKSFEHKGYFYSIDDKKDLLIAEKKLI